MIDQRFGMPALLFGHAAVAGGGRGSGGRGTPAQRLFGGAGQGAETHAGDGDGNIQMDGLFGETGAKPDIGRAFLAVAFQRIAADRGAKEQQVIEMRQAAFRSATADVIDAGCGGAADFGVHVVGKGP